MAKNKNSVLKPVLATLAVVVVALGAVLVGFSLGENSVKQNVQKHVTCETNESGEFVPRIVQYNSTTTVDVEQNNNQEQETSQTVENENEQSQNQTSTQDQEQTQEQSVVERLWDSL